MQTLDVISVNLWNILISLANLTIIFLLFKKFLFKPVMKMLDARQAAIDAQYSDAEKANTDALRNKENWEEKMKNADTEADEIIKKAANDAKIRGDRIVSEAREKADGIIRVAEMEAELEKKKAESAVKHEIVMVSAAIAEKMLAREVKPSDHRELIDSFIENIGGGND
ncbi:MAG: F0F1 ATP synthase subunit B [Clostridia bacterium]|nr:F0F1 ATP synthase subunit B [Clostridia bacterium]